MSWEVYRSQPQLQSEGKDISVAEERTPERNTKMPFLSHSEPKSLTFTAWAADPATWSHPLFPPVKFQL